MEILKKAFHFFIYTNLFIAFAAVALVFTNQLTIESNFAFTPSICFVFFATLFTYSYLKFNQPAIEHHLTDHIKWTKKHPQLSKNILLISLIGMVSFFFLLNKIAVIYVAGLALITAFYGFVSIPFLKPKRKLRDFGLIKTGFVAFVWSVTTVIVPLAGQYVETDLLIFLLIRRFLFVLALTIVFEIKDITHDGKSKLTTLPMQLGISNTKLLAQFILFLLMGLVVVQYLFFDISLSNMIAINLSLLTTIFCIQPIDENTSSIWYYTLLDGMMILQFILIFLTTKYFG